MKLLVFDWDGTLIDSADRIISCMRQAAADLTLPKPAAEAVRDIIGLGLPEALEKLFGRLSDEQQRQMRQRYAFYYIEQDDTPTEFFPGVIEGLTRLRERGYQLAVATGKSRQGLDRVLAETATAELFDYSRCADETRSKPHPLMLEQLLQAAKLEPHQALMVGDTEYDLEMATNAGVASVGVSYGSHHPERLALHNPRLVIDHFGELEAWLDGLSNY